jgi:hypothetical protein
MDAVSTTNDSYSFVDNTELARDVNENIESPTQEGEASEFEGFGSMFD